MKCCISGKGYKHLTRFSRFVLFNLQLVLCKTLTLSAASVFVTDSLFIYIYFLLLEENHQNWISRAGEKISPTISLFLRACSHEPGTVNYSGVMIAPGQALPRVHMMICCPGAMLPRGKFIVI